MASLRRLKKVGAVWWGARIRKVSFIKYMPLEEVLVVQLANLTSDTFLRNYLILYKFAELLVLICFECKFNSNRLKTSSSS